MIWWILNDGCFDYHKCTGPNYRNDPFVKKLVDAGTVVTFGLIELCHYRVTCLKAL